ncbi:MAG: hypothetical protein H6719_38745 [Sandaracinaceae bacterium]|nr:hypothetical protein [Sandaracinaceae bacterium]
MLLQPAVFGALVISGFWSVVNERFDPHSAKQMIGRIGTGATFGGVAGGLLAAFVSVTAPVCGPSTTVTFSAWMGSVESSSKSMVCVRVTDIGGSTLLAAHGLGNRVRRAPARPPRPC